MSARAVKSAVSTLADHFRTSTGVEPVFDFAPVGALEKKLAAGASADVVILSAAAIDVLEHSGRSLPESAISLGRTSIGVAVRAGAAMPDIGTPEAFKATLLAVESIAVSDPAVGGTAARYLPQLFARMDIAAALDSKLRLGTGGGDVTEKVARGEAQLGITFISEMLPIAGARVVGPLPAIYDNPTLYRGAVLTDGRARDLGLVFLRTLADRVHASVWRAAGLEPA